MRNGKIIWATALALSTTALVACQQVAQEDTIEQATDAAAEKLAANKAVVQRVFDEFYNDRNIKTVTEYMAEDHVQHNPNEGNGTNGLIEYFRTNLWSQPGDMDAVPYRMIAEGDLVVTQAHWSPPGQDDNHSIGLVSADIYRVVDGKVVEHWDAAQPIPEGESVNGNTMLDGGTLEPASPETVAMNKQIVLRYMEEVINQRNVDVLDEIMIADWQAHNAGEPNGRDNLKEYLGGLFGQFPEVHADVKRVVAEGNFVVTQSQYTMNEKDRGNDFAQPSGATFDFFRLENGKIVEHWDVIQRPVPEKSVNGNSMFDGAELYNYRAEQTEEE